jgi:antitoxin CptB
MVDELRGTQADAESKLGERALSKLKWRCRRGLLENDLFIERFFKRYEPTLTVGQADGLNVLMDLSDNDLLDLIMRRSQAAGDTATPQVQQVLGMLQA